MKRALLAVLIGALIAMALGTVARAGAEHARPLKGQCSASFEVQSIVFPTLTLSLHGTCQLTHLGATTWTGTQWVNLVDGTFTNQFDYRAANGDILHGATIGTTIGDPNAPTPVFTGTETYAGGTGRFESASGETTIDGGASYATSTGYWTTSGTITFGG